MTVALRACACPYAPCTRAYTAYARPRGPGGRARRDAPRGPAAADIQPHHHQGARHRGRAQWCARPSGPFAYSGHLWLHGARHQLVHVPRATEPNTYRKSHKTMPRSRAPARPHAWPRRGGGASLPRRAKLKRELVARACGRGALASVAGPHFLINPFGLRFDEVTASNLLKATRTCPSPCSVLSSSQLLLVSA